MALCHYVNNYNSFFRSPYLGLGSIKPPKYINIKTSKL